MIFTIPFALLQSLRCLPECNPRFGRARENLPFCANAGVFGLIHIRQFCRFAMVTKSEFSEARARAHRWLVFSVFPLMFGISFIAIALFPKEVNPDFRSNSTRIISFVAGLGLASLFVWMLSRFVGCRTELECPTCKDWLPSKGRYVLMTGKCRKCQTQIISDHTDADSETFKEVRKEFSLRRIAGQFLATFGSLFVGAAFYPSERSDRKWSDTFLMLGIGVGLVVSGALLAKARQARLRPRFWRSGVAGVICSLCWLLLIICVIFIARTPRERIPHWVGALVLLLALVGTVSAIVWIFTGFRDFFCTRSGESVAVNNAKD